MPAEKLPTLSSLSEYIVTEAEDRVRYANDWTRAADGSGLLLCERVVREVVHTIKAGSIRNERLFFDANPDGLDPIEYQYALVQRLKAGMKRLSARL